MKNAISRAYYAKLRIYFFARLLFRWEGLNVFRVRCPICLNTQYELRGAEHFYNVLTRPTDNNIKNMEWLKADARVGPTHTFLFRLTGAWSVCQHALGKKVWALVSADIQSQVLESDQNWKQVDECISTAHCPAAVIGSNPGLCCWNNTYVRKYKAWSIDEGHYIILWLNYESV